jgi:hypothetical protein
VRDRVLVLAAQAGLLGLSVVFLVVPASALFLARYGAEGLPFIYLAVAVLGVVLSRVMHALQARLSLVAVARWCIGSFVVLVAVSWLLLRVGDQIWVSAVLVGLFPLSIPVGFVLVGTQAGRLLDIRSMKRYFARIVAGFSLGFVVGGLATAALTGPLGGPVDLLLIDVFVGLAYLGVVVLTGRRFPDELAQRPVRHLPAARARSVDDSPPARDPLFLVVFGYQILAAAVTQLLDYIVWERAAFHFPDPSDLARFQGLFGTLLNVVALAFVFLAAGRLLVRFGERGGLATNPVGVVLLLVLGTVVGLVGGADGTVFFVVMCAQQAAHIALTDGMTRAAINTAYQALDPPTRLRAQTVVEAAGVPLALGFVGVLLLAFRVTHLGVRAVVVVTLVLAVAWLVTAVVAYRHYRAGVLALVTARPWEPRDLSESDDGVVMALLASPDVRDVMVGLAAVRPARRPAAEVAVLMAAADPYARMTAFCELIGAGGDAARAAQDRWTTAVAGADRGARGAALAGCAAAPDPFFVPYLVDAITASAPSAALADAVQRHAAGLAPVVVARLSQEHSGPVRERLVSALGAIRDALPAAPPGLPDIGAEVADRAARVARATAAAARLEDDPALEILHRALVEDIEHSARHLADHLAMHHGSRHVDRIVAALGDDTTDQRALATELLEVLVGRQLGEQLVVLLAPWAGRDELAEALAAYDAPDRTTAEWVTDLAQDPAGRWADPWLRACALHAAPAVLGTAARDVAATWVDDDDPVVAETARWALEASHRT